MKADIMIKLLYRILLLIFLSPFALVGQNIDHLKGKWQDSEKKSKFDLEVDGNNVRWKNEKNENWTNLTWVSGTDYVDDDDYKYEFNAKKGTVSVINPDNVRDVRVASMINFIPPGKTAPEATRNANPKASHDSEYKGAHGFILTYRGSTKAPIGIGLGGIGKKMGFYGAFRFSSRPEGEGIAETPLTSNADHQVTDGDYGNLYVYTGYQTETRGALTFGPIIPINPYFSIFGGIGIGWSNQWELYDVYDIFDQELDNNYPQDYAINEDESVPIGFEFEFGAMAHWNVLNVTAGLSFVNFTSADFVLGIGFQFY